jgi:hypothetical protein
MPLIPALWRLRQEDCKLEASLANLVKICLKNNSNKSLEAALGGFPSILVENEVKSFTAKSFNFYYFSQKGQRESNRRMRRKTEESYYREAVVRDHFKKGKN